MLCAGIKQMYQFYGMVSMCCMCRELWYRASLAWQHILKPCRAEIQQISCRAFSLISLHCMCRELWYRASLAWQDILKPEHPSNALLVAHNAVNQVRVPLQSSFRARAVTARV